MKNRTLKRPMFRKGGPAMEGIMSGIQDRELKAGGGQIGGGSIYGRPMGNRTGYAEPRDARGLTMENIALLKELAPRPVDKDLSKMLIQGGLAALSGKGATGNTLQDVASAFQTPAAQYAEAQAKRDEYDSELGLAAAKLGIAQAGEERVQQIKNQDLDYREKMALDRNKAVEKQARGEPLDANDRAALQYFSMDDASRIDTIAKTRYDQNDILSGSKARYDVLQRTKIEDEYGKNSTQHPFNKDTRKGFVPQGKKNLAEFLKRDDVEGVILYDPNQERSVKIMNGKFVPLDSMSKEQSKVEKPEVEEISGRIPQDAIGRKKYLDALKKSSQRKDELRKKRQEDQNKKIKDYNEKIRLKRQLGN